VQQEKNHTPYGILGSVNATLNDYSGIIREDIGCCPQGGFLMDYHVALPPEMGLNAQDVVALWNTDPACRAVATATLIQAPRRDFTPFTDALIGLAGVAGTVGLGVGTNALYDLLKDLLVKHGVKKCTRLTELEQPDGTHLLVLEIEEE
jgi:hypothetical protein